MIIIQKSQTADTRTCDFANTSKETLLASSRQHIGDVVKALAFFSSKLTEAAGEHDYDKLTAIDWFHADFVTGFKETGWWDNHRKIHRHHIDKADGVPENVNLIDVLEHIADCVMAGMARSGSVYRLELSSELLQEAFQNTVTLLRKEVRVSEGKLEGYQKELAEGMCEDVGIPKVSEIESLQNERDTLKRKVQELEGRIANALA